MNEHTKHLYQTWRDENRITYRVRHDANLDYSALSDAELAAAYVGATAWRKQCSTADTARNLRPAIASVLAIIDEQSRRLHKA